MGALPVHGQADDALPALISLIAESDDTQFQVDLLKGLADGLKGRRQVPSPEGWEALAAKLRKSDHPEIRKLEQALSLKFGNSAALRSLRRQLRDNSAPASKRLEALTRLLASKDPALVEVLPSLLSADALRRPVLRAMAAYDDPKLVLAILNRYRSFSVEERRDALNTLVSRPSYARRLVKSVEGKQIPAGDLTADVVRQLRHLKDPAINRFVQEHWGLSRDTDAEKQKQIANYKKVLAGDTSGSPSRGRAVYARACQQCHTLFGRGGKVGPDITGSNRADLDYILHNIVAPNADIPNDYRTSVLETRDERVLNGIVTRQDGNAVTLVTANDTVTVPRNEIESLYQSELSMMPEGLAEAMGDQDLKDLIAYLKSPKQVPMQATPDNVESFFNGDNLTGWAGNMTLWSVKDGEIIGKTDGLKRNEFLVSDLLLGDFKLTCEVRLRPNRENSGIQFRSHTLPGREVKGYQADIGAGWWGKLYEEHGRALLWDRPGDAHVKVGEWNTYEIVARGSRIQTSINGQPCVDLDDPEGARQGIIALQLHSGGAMEIRFRNFKLEILESPGK